MTDEVATIRATTIQEDSVFENDPSKGDALMTNSKTDAKNVQQQPSNSTASETACSPNRACPVCGGVLIDIRHKLQCQRCHTICETCCEGGRG